MTKTRVGWDVSSVWNQIYLAVDLWNNKRDEVKPCSGESRLLGERFSELKLGFLCKTTNINARKKKKKKKVELVPFSIKQMGNTTLVLYCDSMW